MIALPYLKSLKLLLQPPANYKYNNSKYHDGGNFINN